MNAISNIKRLSRQIRKFPGATIRLRNTVNMNMKKAKCNFYSTKLSNDQNLKEKWKTLNDILPKKNKTTLGASEKLLATKFNKFFTTIAESFFSVYKDSSPPKVVAPRVNKNFVLDAVSAHFVRQQLQRLKSTAPVIAKPITRLINRTFSTGVPADLDPPRIGSPGPIPLADMDAPV